MCERGDVGIVRLKVKVAWHVSVSGWAWRDIKIDRCMVRLVKALQRGGIETRSSCCGHGKHNGYIELADGYILRIEEMATSDKPQEAAEWR